MIMDKDIDDYRGWEMKMLPGSRVGSIDRQVPLPIPSHTRNPVLPAHFLLWVIQYIEILIISFGKKENSHCGRQN